MTSYTKLILVQQNIILKCKYNKISSVPLRVTIKGYFWEWSHYKITYMFIWTEGIVVQASDLSLSKNP